jgi:hypothetical protein
LDADDHLFPKIKPNRNVNEKCRRHDQFYFLNKNYFQLLSNNLQLYF